MVQIPNSRIWPLAILQNVLNGDEKCKFCSLSYNTNIVKRETHSITCVTNQLWLSIRKYELPYSFNKSGW